MNNITASKLRIILVSTLLAVLLASGGIFYVANQELTKVADQVSGTVAEANASQNNLQILQQTQRELDEKSDVVLRAGKVVANSQSYQYQNQIINDLTSYANRAKISFTNITFSSDNKAEPSTTVLPAGVKAATIAVTLKNPVNYNNLLRFMNSIEQNLTKMQIASINLATDDTSGVSSDVLNIQVYVR